MGDFTKQKLLAIDCLRVLKEGRTFRGLSKQIGIPAGLLNRYLNSDVLPKTERAKHILSFFYKTQFQKSISKLSKLGDGKYIVTGEILSQPFFLKIIASRCHELFPSKIDVVLSAAVDGIPIAIMIGDTYEARCAYAKKTQEIAFSDHFTSKESEEKPLTSPFYLPKSMIKRGDRVLIVDDVIRAGSTTRALLSICEQAKVEIIGIFAIFATNEAIKTLSKEYKIDALFVIKD